MDFEIRKYKFIQELVHIESENILHALEQALKREKAAHRQIDTATKHILDQRLESYKNNPDDILDWEDVKTDW